MTEPYQLTACEAAEALQNGSLSSSELTRSVLDRIESLDVKVKAFQTVMPEKALTMAQEIDERRTKGEELHPWAGVPIALKDNFCLKEAPCTCSSKILETFIPPYNATVVDKMLAAG